MPRTCTICGHAERETIDKALIAKEAYRHIASQFGTSTAALQRHQPHLRGDLVEAHKAAGVERATSLLDDIHHSEARIEGLHGAVEMVLRRAFDAKDLKSAVAAIKAAADLLREGREYLELRGTVTGELDSPTTMINPIFGEQRIQLLALPKCDDVREHVPLDATNKPD